MSARSFAPLMTALRGGPRVLAIDLPGSGRSQSAGRIGTPEEVADLLWSWLDSQHVHRVVLVGHSLGAQIVTRLAVSHPERVASLILIAPAPDPEAGGPTQTALRLLRGWIWERPRFMTYAIVDFLRARPHRMWKVLTRSMAVVDPDILSRCTTPTVMVRGERDAVSTGPGVRKLADAFVDAQVQEIPKGPHGLQFFATDELADVIRTAVRKAQDPPEA